MVDRAMKMEPMESSCVAAAGYDVAGHVLRIRFVGGGTYDYLGVSAPVFRAFREADSKGGYVNHLIKPHYPARQVD